jgi:hypothetical protein
MLRTILCTIDFSPSSKQVVKCAADLALDLQAHLTVLYTYRLMVVKNDEAFEGKRMIEESAVKNFALMEKEILTGLDITYDFKTEVGFVTDRIEAHARESKLGFIVIDRNMSINSKEAFDELVENVPVPMVIVP